MDEKDEFEKGLEAITIPENWLNGNQYRTGYRKACLEIAATYRAFKAKAVEATAEGSLVEKLNDILPIGTALCGECGGNGYVLEKSGMGEEQDPIACPDCHGRGLRNISELGYRPASPAVEGLVRELMECLSGDNDYFMHLNGEAMKGRAFIPKKMIEEILAKYDKGGK